VSATSRQRAARAGVLALACGAPQTSDDAADTSSEDTETPETDDTDTPPETDDTETPETDESETDESDAPPPAACDLGTGTVAFVGFVPWVRDEVEVVRGRQGLWHVVGAVRCTGVVPGDAADILAPTNPTVSWEILDPVGLVIAGYDGLRRPMGGLGPGANLLDEYLVFRTATYAEALDRDATMRFRLEDADGTRVEVEEPVRLVPPDGWVPIDTGPAR
jgi:hypothetical protein